MEMLRVEPDSYADAWSRPAGFAWSSAEQLATFGGFILDGNDSVLSNELWQEMRTAQVSTKQVGDYENYGYGLMVNPGFFLGSDWIDEPLLSHGGAIPGFSASLYVLPEHELALAILSNADGAYFGESVVATLSELIDLNIGEAPDLWDESISMEDYVGSYSDPWNVGDIEVSWDGTQLGVSMPDLDALGITYDPVLIPYTTDNYLFNVTGSSLLITFMRDDAGTVSHFRNRYFVGERVADSSEGKSAGEEETGQSDPGWPTIRRSDSTLDGQDWLRRVQTSEPSLTAILKQSGR